MALKLALCCVLLLALSATAAGATTEKRTNACLKRHHVATGPRPLKEVTRFGIRVVRYEGFSFRGVPPKVYDNGALIFERTHAIAVTVQKNLFKRLAAFQIAHSQDSPFHIYETLRHTEQVIGNVVVVWSNDPQKLAAKRILRGCLLR